MICNQTWAHRFVRRMIGVCTLIVNGVVAFLLVMPSENDEEIVKCVPFFLLMLAFWWYIAVSGFYETAFVELSDEGIFVRVLLKKQFYQWSEIPQAGIAWRAGGKGDPNWFVILLPGGSPRKHKDITFFLRNTTKLIRLPRTSEVRQYVIAHYGPLDFDLSDGQPEQSIVVD